MDFLLGMLLVTGPWLLQARIISAPRQARLSLAEPQHNYYHTNIDGNPGTYSFGYDIADPSTGNNQFRTEERYPNGTVIGSYGYVSGNGKLYHYKYIADDRGYRVTRIQPNTQQLSSTPTQHFPQEITWSRKKKPIKNKEQTWKPAKGYDIKQKLSPLGNRLQRPVYYTYS